MRIVVLYNEPSEDAAFDPCDVLVQRDTVMESLATLGHESQSLGCTLNLAAVQSRLHELRPEVVFNLVESLGGSDRLMTLATNLLDATNSAYTGATTESILATSNKLAAKQRLAEATLPTPAWVPPRHAFPTEGRRTVSPPVQSDVTGKPVRWIIKPVWEHASFGLDDTAIVSGDTAAVEVAICDRQYRVGCPHFAEQFVEGREFNLSLLAGEVLPPAEIDFSAFPADKPRIVGQQAKWQPNSFEYRQTPRRFDFPAADTGLLDKLVDLSRCCWRLFDLRGYARVDYRVDRDGRPWILEINVNPCLSPDAGFAAAVARAGIEYDEAIQRIIDEVSITRADQTPEAVGRKAPDVSRKKNLRRCLAG